jgi:serine/threonine protein kinase
MSDLQIAPPPDDELALEVRRRALKARLLGEQGPGPRIGRFVVDQVIGRGAMGVVYRAHDDRLDRPVAIKVLRADAASALARLEREARALARLNHPNVVTVYEVGEHDAIYIAMEYVQGRSLREWMAQPQPLAQRIEFLRQAALGLAAAHAIGLVHRDFKPANAIVGDDGRLRIVDFGLATAPLSDTTLPEHIGTAMSRLTQTGAQLGTPAYMAPELLRGEPPSPASDQFALCCVGWELMFGRHPFEGRERDDPPSVPRDASVPRALGQALSRGLSPHAKDRDLQQVIAACVPVTRRRRSRVWLAGVSSLMIVGGVALAVFGARPAPRAAPECNPTLSSASRHTLISDLDMAISEQAPLRAAAVELALGRWDDACTRLAAAEGDALHGAGATCWRDHYCRDRASLPSRARCFGGDVIECKRAAIPHEYEYLASTQALAEGGDRSVAASAELHLAHWTELMDVACELGDRESCDALARRRR